MGMVVDFHATSSRSRRAAKSVSTSAVTPDDLAGCSGKIADHHSAGMRSLCHHFRTRAEPAPLSEPNASREGQRAITDRNELISTMPKLMGPTVPNVKANMSRDDSSLSGQVVHMDRASEELTERRWRDEFKRRLKEARGLRSQQDMADLLGVSRDAYSKYEGGRETDLPIRLIPKFCKICAVTPEWLILGGEKPAAARKSRDR